MRANKHLTELDEVAVFLIVNLNSTPGIPPSTDLASVSGRNFGVGTDNSKGNLGKDLVVLGDGLFIVKLVSRTLEDLDVVVSNVGEDLVARLATKEADGLIRTHSLLEGNDFIVGQRV